MPQNIVGFEAERNYREDPFDLPSHPRNESFLVNFISGLHKYIFSSPSTIISHLLFATT